MLSSRRRWAFAPARVLGFRCTSHEAGLQKQLRRCSYQPSVERAILLSISKAWFDIRLMSRLTSEAVVGSSVACDNFACKFRPCNKYEVHFFTHCSCQPLVGRADPSRDSLISQTLNVKYIANCTAYNR